MQSFDVNFEDLTKAIYTKEPTEPYSFYLEFLSEIDSQKLSKMLGYFIQYGSKYLFDCELSKLTSDQIVILQNYLKSIGYDVEYNVQQTSKTVIDYNPDGTSFEKSIPINFWNISFKKADIPDRGGCGNELNHKVL